MKASEGLPKGGRIVRLIPQGDRERKDRHAILRQGYWWTKSGTWDVRPGDEWSYEEKAK